MKIIRISLSLTVSEMLSNQTVFLSTRRTLRSHPLSTPTLPSPLTHSSVPRSVASFLPFPNMPLLNYYSRLQVLYGTVLAAINKHTNVLLALIFFLEHQNTIYLFNHLSETGCEVRNTHSKVQPREITKAGADLSIYRPVETFRAAITRIIHQHASRTFFLHSKRRS